MNSDWIYFGEFVMGKTYFKECNIILGGDLNFSVSMSETWGQNGHLDLLLDFFLILMECNGITNKIKSTLCNRRGGNDFIVNLLGCFLVLESLL